jgi:signal transduction histidine kinase
LPLVQGDRVQLLQVMVNLIINAIEAGRHVSNVPILLQKSKIERCRKSRESGFLDALPLQYPVAPMRRSVVIFVQNDEVPHIASYETHPDLHQTGAPVSGPGERLCSGKRT